MNERGCKGCYYLSYLSDGTPFCDYAKMAGITRAKKEVKSGPDGSCELKITRSQQREIEGTRRMELYRLGYTDKEIAAACMVSTIAICHWRNKLGLPPNKRHQKEGAIS